MHLALRLPAQVIEELVSQHVCNRLGLPAQQFTNTCHRCKDVAMRCRTLLVAFVACLIPAVVTSASTTHAAHTAPATTDHLVSSSRTQKQMGLLHIPRLRVTTPIFNGVTNAQFDIGVGQWPGSPKPGAKGNIVIGGHRTSAKRPFADIDKLKNGDEMFLYRDGKKYRYVVSKSMIVTRTAMWIINPTSTPTLTLFSCHPKGQISHRYVIRATFVS
jgi:sortase A